MKHKIDAALKLIERLRKNGAIVHCVTNTVVQNFTANILLACGATPSMTTSIDEIEDFVSNSNTLMINLGTLDEQRRIVSLMAMKKAAQADKPILLDPVMCNLSSVRLKFAHELIKQGPSIIRSNKQEADSLFLNIDAASKTQCLAITGKTDLIIYGDEKISVANGDAYMHRVTGVGCAQSALIAALATCTQSHDEAVLAGLLWFGVAGELAAQKSNGPSSFQTHFIDTLFAIDLETIKQLARVEKAV